MRLMVSDLPAPGAPLIIGTSLPFKATSTALAAVFKVKDILLLLVFFKWNVWVIDPSRKTVRSTEVICLWHLRLSFYI